MSSKWINVAASGCFSSRSDVIWAFDKLFGLVKNEAGCQRANDSERKDSSNGK